ncbi:MAG: outer membrane beta-barrel protein [Candidatus Acidiferrales bacterium]
MHSHTTEVHPNWAGPKFTATLLFLLTASLSLCAQEPETRGEIFLQLGPSLFSDTSAQIQIPFFDITTGTIVFFPARRTDSLATGTRLFVGLRYYFTKDDALEAGYSVAETDYTERDVVFTPSGTAELVVTVPVTAVFVSFNYVRYLKRGARYQPFGTVGLGFAHFSGFPSPTKFSGNFGAGLDIALRSHVALRAEYRLFLAPRPKLGRMDLLGGPGSLDGVMLNHAPSVGLVLKF